MRTLIAIVLYLSFSALAAAPPRGGDQLRNLVVFPEMSLNFNMAMQLQENQWRIPDNDDEAIEISQISRKLKSDPDNSKMLLRLAYLLNENDNTNGAQVCFEKVAKLCRDKVAANPEDSMTLDDLAEALSGLGRNDEAEAVYRKATLVNPGDWRCWVNLGNFLPEYSFFSIYPQNLRFQLAPGQQPPQAVLNYRPSTASLEKAENALVESSKCFDKAIAIAPREREIYFQRAGFMMISNFQSCFFLYYRGNEKQDPSKWFMTQFSDETLANLKMAAELSPEDPDYAGLSASFECVAAARRANTGNFTQDMLPDTTRRSVDKLIARLENLSQNPDEHVAARALEYLAFLNFMFDDPRTAASQLRRAVALDPAREQSWDMLLAAAMKDGNFPDEAVVICKSRLKYKNSSRNHLFLAKAYQRKNEWTQAAVEAQIAAILDTNYFAAPLMLAAIDLKQTEHAEFMPKANQQIARAGELLGRMTSGAESWQRWRELSLDTAIFDGLQATPDFEKTARQCLEQVLKYYPGDETAKAILEALPPESPSGEAQGD